MLIPVLGQSKPQAWCLLILPMSGWRKNCCYTSGSQELHGLVRTRILRLNSTFSAPSLLLAGWKSKVKLIAIRSVISSLHMQMQFPLSIPGCPWQSVLCPAGCSTHGTASRGTGSSWPSWAWRTVMMGCTAAQQITGLEQPRRAVGLSRWKCVSGNAISSWRHVSV